MMLPTDTFTFFQIGEAENKFSSWGWLMLSVKPDFLTTK
jgi:hypothetical protein